MRSDDYLELRTLRGNQPASSLITWASCPLNTLPKPEESLEGWIMLGYRSASSLITRRESHVYILARVDINSYSTMTGYWKSRARVTVGTNIQNVSLGLY